jgi:hypothetical protein
MAVIINDDAGGFGICKFWFTNDILSVQMLKYEHMKVRLTDREIVAQAVTASRHWLN